MLLIDSASMALNSASLWLAFSPSDSALEKLAIRPAEKRTSSGFFSESCESWESRSELRGTRLIITKSKGRMPNGLLSKMRR